MTAIMSWLGDSDVCPPGRSWEVGEPGKVASSAFI